MIVGGLSPGELERRLCGPGLALRTGPVVTRIRSPLAAVAQGIALFYDEHRLDEEFADFEVRIASPRGVRRWLRPKAAFEFDGVPPFHPLPADQAFPMMEWGLNWCVSSHCHQYLILHAAALERDGHALLLPAPPGAGKSTLCAGLVAHGWRLLSDELALVDPASGKVVALARPIGLKNASIDVIARFAPQMRIGPAVSDTVKGRVAHLKPPAESVRREADPALPRWVVVPRYAEAAPASLQPLSRARTFMHLAESAFNYDLHGARGFELLGRLVESCDCHEFAYGDLHEAVRAFDAMAGGS